MLLSQREFAEVGIVGVTAGRLAIGFCNIGVAGGWRSEPYIDLGQLPPACNVQNTEEHHECEAGDTLMQGMQLMCWASCPSVECPSTRT